MSVTQQIKDRLDIVQYIQEFVPDLKKAGRYHKACCPFHGEKTPSFVVNADTQSWRCFGACAEGGDIFTFAQKMNGWDFSEALRELAERTGVELKKRSPEQQAQDEKLDKWRGLMETAAKWYHEYIFSDDAKAEQTLIYAIEQRGFTEQTIKDWGIGYAPDGWHHMLNALKEIGYNEDDIVAVGLASRNDKGNIYDRFRNRLMIPIRDDRGNVVGFGARALDPDDAPKYLNSPQTSLFDKSSTLFGLDRAKSSIRDSETAVIVEGYMDVIQAHQAGFTNVVAQMGTAMTEAQIKLLAPRHAKNIVMALDADDAGQNATRRSLEVARTTLMEDYMGKMAIDIRVLQIDDAKDPDDVLRETPEKWADYVKAAVPVADFVINMEMADLPANASVAVRQQVAQKILPILTASENNLYTKDNVQKLALRLHIPESDLLGWARELERIEQAKKPKARPPQRLEMPPLLDDDYHHSSEEPPPFFEYDDDVVSDEYRGQTQEQPSVSAPMPQLSGRSASRATEAYCLRMLLLNPSTMAQVNRKLRQLADNNPQMLAGPLAEFCVEDFSQGDYRVVLDALQLAMQQDTAEPLDYLQETIDDNLVEEVSILLLDEPDDVHHKVNQRLQGEFADIWGKFARSIRPSIDTQADVVRRALKVRHQRLEREQQEIRFLLEDAQRNGETEAEHSYFAQSIPTIRALRLLQQELKRETVAW